MNVAYVYYINCFATMSIVWWITRNQSIVAFNVFQFLAQISLVFHCLIRGYSFDEIEQCICFLVMTTVWLGYFEERKWILVLQGMLCILMKLSLHGHVAIIAVVYGTFFGIMGVYVDLVHHHHHHHQDDLPERLASS